MLTPTDGCFPINQFRVGTHTPSSSNHRATTKSLENAHVTNDVLKVGILVMY